MADRIKLDDSMEDIARRLGKLYAEVSVSRDPMFSWLHITNDATVLGEELRRNRESEAADRAGKILIRLLEFLGYYLYCHPGKRGELSDLVASTLRAPSFEEHKIQGLEEGPSRWILVKFPYSCSKCGQSPCHCMVYPLVLENRREDPQEYLAKFKERAEKARKDLATKEHKPLSLRSMFVHFRSIYHNSYCHQDPWKIAMHLYEEIGEATTELSRMNLQWRAIEAGFDLDKALAVTFAISTNKLASETSKIKDAEVREKRKKDIEKEMAGLKERFAAKPWDVFGHLVGEKFKEEVSDVFSWISAVIGRLDPNLKGLEALLKTLSREEMGDVLVLACKYCHKTTCDNDCLITHGVSAEIAEKLSKF